MGCSGSDIDDTPVDLNEMLRWPKSSSVGAADDAANGSYTDTVTSADGGSAKVTDAVAGKARSDSANSGARSGHANGGSEGEFQRA